MHRHFHSNIGNASRAYARYAFSTQLWGRGNRLAASAATSILKPDAGAAGCPFVPAIVLVREVTTMSADMKKFPCRILSTKIKTKKYIWTKLSKQSLEMSNTNDENVILTAGLFPLRNSQHFG